MTDFASAMLDKYALVRRQMHSMSKNRAPGKKAMSVIDVSIGDIIGEKLRN